MVDDAPDGLEEEEREDDGAEDGVGLPLAFVELFAMSQGLHTRV